MTLFFVLFAALAAAFSFVLLFGAPYVPTLKSHTALALDLLNLKEGDTLLELGSGDGRMLAAAARRGLNAVGYEINPLLFAFSLIRTWPYRKNVKVKFQNYWQADWPKTQGVYVFLLQKYMPKLDKKIVSSYGSQKIKLVSLAFKIPGKKIKRQLRGLYLYQY